MSKSIEPDRKERTRLDKLNQSIKRKQGFFRVAEAIKNGFSGRHEITDYLGLCSPGDLSLATKVGFVIETEEGFYLTGKKILQEDYLDPWLNPDTLELLDKPRKKQSALKASEKGEEKLNPPILPGCKCRNADQGNIDYWLFTGSETEIKLAANYLNELGISVWPHENGINGNYKLMVPIWVSGVVTVYYEDLETKGEIINYVQHSIAA